MYISKNEFKTHVTLNFGLDIDMYFSISSFLNTFVRIDFLIIFIIMLVLVKLIEDLVESFRQCYLLPLQHSKAGRGRR